MRFSRRGDGSQLDYTIDFDGKLPGIGPVVNLMLTRSVSGRPAPDWPPATSCTPARVFQIPARLPIKQLCLALCVLRCSFWVAGSRPASSTPSG